ncbi:hypothetical protein NUW54_g6338 [Trametes sanguinea]|uniref:Uncharacterized protein n=2 Tax=Trametes sanguinea TaxID=158606 RepID=A0ACC1PVI6_9APHY|nr:hypothetical protein NUW54_g6388 [Trametes sanguinea]KAJ3001576.1 hypothetical protein NUW54_g6338 [Trametes sanguinea]
MAQHHVLSTIEILDEIFHHLQPAPKATSCYRPFFTWIDREGLTALARAARVCKVFYVPACRVLWQQMINLEPLLALVPLPKKPRSCCKFTSLWHSRSRQPSTNNSVSISRSPTSAWTLTGACSIQIEARTASVCIDGAAWDRFRFYAAFVQVLVVKTSPWHVPPIKTLSKELAMQQLFQLQGTIFPNLLFLTWTDELPARILSTRFLSPVMRGLCIACSGRHCSSLPPNDCPWDSHIPALLEQLATHSTAVLKLHLTTSHPCSHWLTLSVTLLPQNRQLSIRSLTLECYHDVTPSPKLQIPGLITLSQMPRLNSLTLMPDLVLISPREHDRIDFPHLRELRLYHRARTCPPTLEIIKSTSLRTLFLELNPWNQMAFQQACSACVTAFPHLENFTGLVASPQNCGEPTIYITHPGLAISELCAPLFRLPDIRSMMICSFNLVQVTDADLVTFSQAWPKLRLLNILSQEDDSPSPVSVSYSGLLHFLDTLPDLVDLCLPRIEMTLENMRNIPPSTTHRTIQWLSAKGLAETHLRTLREELLPNLRVVPSLYAERCGMFSVKTCPRDSDISPDLAHFLSSLAVV